MTRKVWFQLVDEDTRDAFERWNVTYVQPAGAVHDVNDLLRELHAEIDPYCPPCELHIYANRATYNEKNGRSLESPASVETLGLDEDNALIVEVSARPTKVPRTNARWTTTTTLDPTASTLPSVDDNQLPSFWKLDAAAISGFGVHSLGKNLVLYCRKDVTKLFHFLQYEVLRDGRLGYVLGPSGSGKSATAGAFALALARTNVWVVTWIHLSCDEAPACVRLEGNSKKTTHLSVRYLAGGELEAILNDVNDTKNHFVLLDGLSVDHNMEKLTCTEWFMQNRANRRLVVVTAMSIRGKIDEQSEHSLGVRELHTSSWVLSEYLEAVKNDELFESVRAQLDSSDDLEPKGTELTLSWRQTLVRSKFYFAGGKARYMFDRSTAEVVELLQRAVHNLSDGGYWPNDTIHVIYSRVGRETSGFISRYAGSAIAMIGGPALVNRLTTYLMDDARAVMDGRMLEMYFFARIRKGGVTLHEGERIITWPQGRFQVVNPENLPELPKIGWLKPHKSNEGSFDAVYVDKGLKLVRFVQVTRANTHALNLGYFHKFLCSLQDSDSAFEIKTLEIFCVVESKALDGFTLTPVTGQCLLHNCRGWPIDEVHQKVRVVGVDGVDRWSQFDW